MQKRSRLSILVSLLLVIQLLFPVANAFAVTNGGNLLPPSNLASQLLTPSDVKLTWSSVYGATGYNVYSIINGQLTLAGTTTTVSYTLNNLPQGSYSYVVSTLSSGSESGPCAPVNVTITYPAMAAPATLTYTIQNGNDIVLNWGASQYAQTYNLYQIGADGQQSLVTSTVNRSYTVSNAADGAYTYAVTAKHSLYGESPLSTPVQVSVVHPTMTAPGNFTYTVSNVTNVTLSWASVSYATNYNVYQIVNGQKVLKSTVTGTSVTYSNLPSGDYVYEVHSNSSRFGESADGSQVSFTIGTVTMVAPSNFTYNLQNVNDIVLTWGTVPYATNYKVYQIVNGQKVLKSTVTGTTVTYPSMPAGDYVYEVHSYSNTFGESAAGSQVSLTVSFAPMAAPGNIAYKLQNGNDIVLTWDAATNATNYKVYQIVNGQKVLKSTISTPTVTYTNMPAGDYLFEVHSYSSRFGESSDGSQVGFSIVFPAMLPPANLVQTITGATSFTLNWGASDYATNYKVYQIVNGQKVLKTTVSVTSASFTSMQPGDYTYEVHSYSSRFGESADGSQLTFTLSGQTMLPPTNQTYSVANGNDITLRWTAATNATSYKVYQVTNGQRVLKSTVTGTTVTYTNMPGGDYDFIIDSYSSLLGESPDGAEVTFSLVLPTMAAPGNLAYRIQNGNDVVLTWAAATYATSYKVYEVIDGQEVLKTTVTSLSATISNVAAGDHTFSVHSVSTRFGDSPQGSTITLTMNQLIMVPPSNLTQSVANGNDFTLRWNPVTYATAYNIYQVVNGQKVLAKTVTGTSATFVNMPAGDYSYEVNSYSSRYGESTGSPISFTLVFPIMQAPANFKQTIVNGNDITLSWSASSYATAYNIYQIVDGQKVLKKTLTGTSTSFVNMPAGDYSYEIHSYSDRFGESPDGSQVSFTLVFPVMQAPANFKQTIANGNDITLSWTAASYATAYNVYQIVDGQRVLKNKVTGTSITFTNMPAGDYSYEVNSYSDRFGESPVASAVNFTLVWPVVQPPVLTGTVFNANNLTLTWKSVTWANEYRIYEVTGDTRQLIYKGTALTTQIFNLSEATHYYEMTAYSTRFGESAPSNRLTETIVYPVMQPPIATLTLISSTSAQITWNFVTYANGYNVYEIVNGSPVLLTKNLNNLSYSISNLSYANHDYYVTSYSNSFGESQPSNTVEAKLIVDTVPPVTTANVPADWTNQDVTVTLSATDNDTGVANTYYSVNDGVYATGTSFTVSEEGVNKISFYSVDKAGNQEAAKTAYVKIDKTAPVTKASDVPAWSKDVTLTLTATDALSGAANTYYSVNGSVYTAGTTVALSQEGMNQVSFYSVDQAGNKETAQTVDVKIDRTAPVTASDAPTGWSKDNVTVNLTATDALSGVAKTYYSVNGGDFAEGTSVTISTEGANKVAFYSVDQAGNAEAPQTAEVKIDRTAPVTTANAPTGWSKDDVTVNFTATDSLSGVAKTYYSVNGGDFTEGTSVTVSTEGVNKVAFYSVDQAGNAEAAQTVSVQIDKTPPVIAMDLSAEYKLGSSLQLNYAASDDLSGIASSTMTVAYPNAASAVAVANGATIQLDKPGVYTVNVAATNGAGLETKIVKQFTVYIPATITVTPTVIKGNNGVFTVRVDLPSGFSTQGFDLDSVRLNGVKALTSNNGYYNQAKIGQFKFERSDFPWNGSEAALEFRGLVNGYLVVGQTTVKLQK